MPVGAAQGVLDVAVLVAFDPVRPGLVEGAHQPQARLLHHPPGRDVDGHRPRDHALDAVLGETRTDQRARALGPVPLAPRGSPEPVAELGLVIVIVHDARQQLGVEPGAEDDARQVTLQDAVHGAGGCQHDGRPSRQRAEGVEQCERAGGVDPPVLQRVGESTGVDVSPMGGVSGHRDPQPHSYGRRLR